MHAQHDNDETYTGYEAHDTNATLGATIALLVGTAYGEGWTGGRSSCHYYDASLLFSHYGLGLVSSSTTTAAAATSPWS